MPDADIEALALENHLSPQNVRMALSHALECEPTEAEISALFSRAPLAKMVCVGLSANVFTASLRALVWAFAQSDHVVVKPSSRSHLFIDQLLKHAQIPVELIHPSARDAFVARVRSLPAQSRLSIYGSHRAIDSLANCAPNHVAIERHGPGFSAIVGGSQSLENAVDCLAIDFALFDQRGCLSPRVVIEIGAPSAVYQKMHRALQSPQISPRTLTPLEIQEHVHARALGRMCGEVLEGNHHTLVRFWGLPTSLPLSPTGRVVYWVNVPTLSNALDLLRPARASITCVATDPAHTITLSAHFARVCALGDLQRLPLDGPVDRRVLK